MTSRFQSEPLPIFHQGLDIGSCRPTQCPTQKQWIAGPEDQNCFELFSGIHTAGLATKIRFREKEPKANIGQPK
jgi:hypothetical protein